jgi:hypothetical protein
VQVACLSYPQCNWSELIRICQEQLGYSPTRVLDSSSIDIKSAQAFPNVLTLDNKLLSNLKQASLSHVFIGFVTDMDLATANEFSLVVRNTVTNKSRNLTILSAALNTWAFQFACLSDDRDVQEYAKQMIHILSGMGLRV